MSRVLVCANCFAHVEVFEAAQGARSAEDHLFLDPPTFVCGGCMERSGSIQVGALSAATVAAGRARTAQERASQTTTEGVS